MEVIQKTLICILYIYIFSSIFFYSHSTLSFLILFHKILNNILIKNKRQGAKKINLKKIKDFELITRISVKSKFLSKMDNIGVLELLKEEMDNDEVAIRVNAIHRLRTIVTVTGSDSFKSQLLPYLESKQKKNFIHVSKKFYLPTFLFTCIALIKKEDDEVLFAIAEELGGVR